VFKIYFNKPLTPFQEEVLVSYFQVAYNKMDKKFKETIDEFNNRVDLKMLAASNSMASVFFSTMKHKFEQTQVKDFFSFDKLDEGIYVLAYSVIDFKEFNQIFNIFGQKIQFGLNDIVRIQAKQNKVIREDFFKTCLMHDSGKTFEGIQVNIEEMELEVD
jgi:hypothetical protein